MVLSVSVVAEIVPQPVEVLKGSTPILLWIIATCVPALLNRAFSRLLKPVTVGALYAVPKPPAKDHAHAIR